MLSEDTIERLTERVASRVENINSYMLLKIAEQIKTIGSLTPSQAREFLQSMQYGNDIREILYKLAEMTELTEQDIFDIFEEVTKKTQPYYAKFYKFRGIDYIPYKDNEPLQRLVDGLSVQYANEFKNLLNTSAYMRYDMYGNRYFTSASEIYQRVTEEALISIAQGRESYNQAMNRTMQELVNSGLQSVDYASGYHKRLDSAVRMNLKEGMITLHNITDEQYGREFGANGKEVTHHQNPALDHSTEDKVGFYDIDGTQFALVNVVREQINSGYEKNIKLKDVQSDRVIVDGKEYMDYDFINNQLNRKIGTLNCGHRTISIVLGVDEPIYSEEELKKDKEENIKGFKFKGKHYTNYEGTQLQRKYELDIKRTKEKIAVYKRIGENNKAKDSKIYLDLQLNEYKKLSEVSGLPTKLERLRTYSK